MNDESALNIVSVSKDFALPHEKSASLKSAFTGILRGKRGRIIERQHALRDISFTVKKGEFFGIVGRNGSGKSTLLKIIAQIYQPTKGSIVVRGRLVPFIELGVGFNPELTGRENVYLSASLMGFSRKETNAIYNDIVAFSELEKFMDQKLKNYSSGMQVRLAFSIATRVEADILLIDEVLAVGDANFQRKCFEYFKQLKKEKKTVVFVSHDMSAVREYCDRAALIEDSKLIAEGDPDLIATEYSKLFMGENYRVAKHTPGSRWGTGIVKSTNVLARVTDQKITIEQTISADKDVSNPVLGFRITDAAGKEVLGTNSHIEGRKIGQVTKGQKKTVRWEFANILSDGTYEVDPSILLDDGITVCDWFDGAAQFVISKERHLPYSIDPGFTLTFKK